MRDLDELRGMFDAAQASPECGLVRRESRPGISTVSRLRDLMFELLKRTFAPAPHVPRLPEEQVRRLYPLHRIDILTTTFIGYATFYVVRNNLSTVAKDMEGALHYDKSMVGDILAASAVAYGIAKFIMGSLSDRSNPRKFMACGPAADGAVQRGVRRRGGLLGPSRPLDAQRRRPRAWAGRRADAASATGSAFASGEPSSRSGTRPPTSAADWPGLSPPKRPPHWGWQSAFYVPALIAADRRGLSLLATARHAAVGRPSADRGIPQRLHRVGTTPRDSRERTLHQGTVRRQPPRRTATSGCSPSPISSSTWFATACSTGGPCTCAK